MGRSRGDALTGDSPFVERLSSTAARRDAKGSICGKGATGGAQKALPAGGHSAYVGMPTRDAVFFGVEGSGTEEEDAVGASQSVASKTAVEYWSDTGMPSSRVTLLVSSSARSAASRRFASRTRVSVPLPFAIRRPSSWQRSRSFGPLRLTLRLRGLSVRTTGMKR